MKNSSDLLKKYLSISEKILSLDFDVDFDKVEDIITEREIILQDMKGLEIKEEDRKSLAERVIKLDKEILEKFSQQKQHIEKNIAKIKKEKSNRGNIKRAFNVYGENKKNENNVFFDKLK